MDIREIVNITDRDLWNNLTDHPMQSFEWGEFRKSTGIQVARYGIYENNKLVEPIQVTIHSIPYTHLTIGYYPKGKAISKRTMLGLQLIAKKYRCIFIKCEPKVELNNSDGNNFVKFASNNGFVVGRPMFTKYNFVLDVTKNEDELLANMKQKTRYNIKVAHKKGVTAQVDNSDNALHMYLKLTNETTSRQGFYSHTNSYHKKMWETMRKADVANMLIAKYEGEIITTWVLFKYGDTLYYPYGASTREHREVMANNLVMWEAIKLARKWHLKYFDMWGALGPEPDKNDPWYGFHNFKEGYGGRHVEYVGTWDYVSLPALYRVYRLLESVRWFLLKLVK